MLDNGSSISTAPSSIDFPIYKTQVDPTSLELLGQVVEHLEGSGGVFCEHDLWKLRDPEPGSLNQDELRQWMTSAQRIVDQTSRLAETLMVLHGVVTRTHKFSQDKLDEVSTMYQGMDYQEFSTNTQYPSSQDCLLRPRGILKLPDELIRYVFKLLQEDDWEEKFHELIMFASVTCRRLREIVISTPSFWNKIYMDMHPEAIEAFLSRSKTELICVLDCRSTFEQVNFRSYEKVIQHRQRWKTLSLTYDFGFDSESVKILQLLSTRLAGLDLPNLCEFEVQFPDVEESPEEEINENAHIYRTWVAPLLRKATFHDTMPRAMHNFQLKILHIEILLFGWIQPEDPLSTMMSCLASQPMLEDLSFTMSSFPLVSEHPIEDRVSLPSLRSLALRIGYDILDGNVGDDSDDFGSSFAVPAILSRLVTPALENLHVDYTITFGNTVEGLDIDSIFPLEREYTSLRCLSLAVYHTNLLGSAPGFSTSPFSGIFEQMPNLEKLCLKMPRTQLNDMHLEFDGPVPPLRCIEFRSCLELDRITLRRILQVLRGSRNWGELELRIVSSPRLRRCAGALADLLPPDRIRIMDE